MVPYRPLGNPGAVRATMSASLVRATVRAVSKRKLQPTRAALTLVSEEGKSVRSESREAWARGSAGWLRREPSRSRCGSGVVPSPFHRETTFPGRRCAHAATGASAPARRCRQPESGLTWPHCCRSGLGRDVQSCCRHRRSSHSRTYRAASLPAHAWLVPAAGRAHVPCLRCFPAFSSLLRIQP